MKILHFLHEVTVGGASLYAVQLLKEFHKLGVPAACATFQDGLLREDLEQEEIPVFLMDGPEQLKETAGDWGATVLHGHTCGGGSHACTVARELGVVGGETIHSMLGGENLQADFEVVQVRGLQAMRPRSTLIQRAFDMRRFDITLPRDTLREQLGIPQAVPVVGRNGRLDGSKAPDEFVKALAKLPQCWGLLVGEGPEFPHLKRLAEDLGCSKRLVMPGFRRDQGNMFNVMDIVLYPTRDESLCCGVVEPLFLEKPVVCYPVGAIGETIIHGETGLHAGCVTDLVNSTNHLLENPDYARRLGKNGRRHLKTKRQHDPVNEARLHLELYENCLKEKGLL